MFEQTFYRCPNCKTDIRKKIEDGEEFSCPSCRSHFKVMLDRKAGSAGFVEIFDKEIPEPLFIPKGSIRAIVTVILALASWIVLMRGNEVPTYHLNVLLTIVGYYFGFRMKMKAAESRIYDVTFKREEPLFLPPGLIRFFLIAGFIITGITLYKRGDLVHLPFLEFFVILTGLIGGYLFSRAVNKVKRTTLYLAFNHLKGAVVLAATGMLAVGLLRENYVENHHTYLILTALVTFYFGSRS